MRSHNLRKNRGNTSDDTVSPFAVDSVTLAPSQIESTHPEMDERSMTSSGHPESTSHEVAHGEYDPPDVVFLRLAPTAVVLPTPAQPVPALVLLGGSFKNTPWVSAVISTATLLAVT